MTLGEFFESFVPVGKGDVKQRLAEYIGIPLEGKTMDMLEWAGVFSNTPVKLKDASPAQILQAQLEEKMEVEGSRY